MAVCVRQATLEDLLAMQRCNLLCLPENYQLKVWWMEGRPVGPGAGGKEGGVTRSARPLLAPPRPGPPTIIHTIIKKKTKNAPDSTITTTS